MNDDNVHIVDIKTPCCKMSNNIQIVEMKTPCVLIDSVYSNPHIAEIKNIKPLDDTKTELLQQTLKQVMQNHQQNHHQITTKNNINVLDNHKSNVLDNHKPNVLDNHKPNVLENCKPCIMIPAGTEVCPDHCVIRNQFFITLGECIRIAPESVNMNININNAQYRVGELVQQTPKNASPIIIPNNTNTFIIPKGTIYYVNDHVIDPIGVRHIFEVDNKVCIKPGSALILSKGMIITSISIAIANAAIISVNQEVSMLLKNNTTCTI